MGFCKHIGVPLLALVAFAGVSLDDSAAEAQGTKALFVAAPSLPGPLRRAIPRVLARGASLVDEARYSAAARGRDLSPASGAAIRRFGSRQGASVIVVAGFGTSGRDRFLRVRYYSGQNGTEIRGRTHRLRGVVLTRAVESQILSDMRAAASRGGSSRPRVAEVDAPAAPTRSTRASTGQRTSAIRRFHHAGDVTAEVEAPESEGGGELPPPVDWDAEPEAVASAGPEPEPAPTRRRRRRAPDRELEAEELEELEDIEDELDEDSEVEEDELDEGGASIAAYMARQWGFDVTAGIGFGQRTSAVPMETGEGRFASSPFPAIHAALNVWLRPSEDSSLRLGLGTRYYTSVGLKAQDQRADGTTRTVDTRAQDLAIGINVNFALADSMRAVRMDLEAGWGFRMLDSELPLSMPTYTLSGPYARVGLFFPIGNEGPLVLGVVPELGHVSSVSEEVAQAGAVSDGFLVGVEAQVRLSIIPELDVDLIYRESHAFLSSEREGDMSDVERFGVLRVTYRP
jgi:hypothetical protein